jgi:hypothetical protein
VFAPLAREVHALLALPGARRTFQDYRKIQPYRNDWSFPPADPLSLTDQYIWLGTVHDLCCCPNEPLFQEDSRDPDSTASALLGLWGSGMVSWPFGSLEGNRPGEPFRHPEHVETLEGYLAVVKADLADHAPTALSGTETPGQGPQPPAVVQQNAQQTAIANVHPAPTAIPGQRIGPMAPAPKMSFLRRISEDVLVKVIVAVVTSGILGIIGWICGWWSWIWHRIAGG